MTWRNREDGYGAVAILFHWAIAALVLALLLLGYAMLRVEDLAFQFRLFQWHKYVGFLVLALVLLRLLWRFSNPRPVLPDTLSATEKRVARAVHWLLYAFMLAIPLSGWAIASVTPLDIPSFVFNLLIVPHLPMPKSQAAEAFWASAHAWLAYAAAVVIIGHSAAALRHHLLLRDETLTRMIRPRGRRRGNGSQVERRRVA
jgi:cytochrome b561